MHGNIVTLLTLYIFVPKSIRIVLKRFEKAVKHIDGFPDKRFM